MTKSVSNHHKSAARYMLGGLLRQPGMMLGALILTFISALLITLPMVLVGQAIDEITNFGKSPQFIRLCWLIVGIAIVYLFMYFIVGYVWAIVTLRWERDARQEFFEALQDYSMTFHDEIESKRMLSVAMQDINWVRMSLNPALRNLTSSLISLILTGIFLVIVDKSFTSNIFSIAGIPVYGFSLIMLIGTPLYLYFAYR